MTSSEVQVAQAWVIDTNIVLDLWLFEDPATMPLRAALQSGAISHLATANMRDELERVLAYPHLVKRMAKSNIQAQDILNRFDKHQLAAEPAAKAPCTCKDPDDHIGEDIKVELDVNFDSSLEVIYSPQRIHVVGNTDINKDESDVTRLETMLKKAIDTENFELASKIKDILALQNGDATEDK